MNKATVSWHMLQVHHRKRFAIYTQCHMTICLKEWTKHYKQCNTDIAVLNDVGGLLCQCCTTPSVDGPGSITHCNKTLVRTVEGLQNLCTLIYCTVQKLMMVAIQTPSTCAVRWSRNRQPSCCAMSTQLRDVMTSRKC